MRRLRSFWRHEQVAVKLDSTAAAHHSAKRASRVDHGTHGVVPGQGDVGLASDKSASEDGSGAARGSGGDGKRADCRCGRAAGGGGVWRGDHPSWSGSSTHLVPQVFGEDFGVGPTEHLQQRTVEEGFSSVAGL